MSKTKNNAVSIVRVTGMLMIIACHLSSWAGITSLAQILNVGVVLFLIISGFLYARKDISSPKQFIMSRWIKICLPMYLMIIVLLPANLYTNADTSLLSLLHTDVIIIRSTVPVGFTEAMCEKTKKSIVFQPEYCGETADHPYADLSRRSWITLGGNKEDIEKAVRVYQQVYSSEVMIRAVDSRTAELAKYMGNCFLATKVTFCNEFYDIAQSLGVNYTELRETWLMDDRIGRSHTFVYPEKRGYEGKCLPKDVTALISQADQLGVDTNLMKAVREKNEKYR